MLLPQPAMKVSQAARVRIRLRIRIRARMGGCTKGLARPPCLASHRRQPTCTASMIWYGAMHRMVIMGMAHHSLRRGRHEEAEQREGERHVPQRCRERRVMNKIQAITSHMQTKRTVPYTTWAMGCHTEDHQCLFIDQYLSYHASIICGYSI